MNNQYALTGLVAKLGTQDDESEVHALWMQNNPTATASWPPLIPSEGDFRLVLRLPSGELAASLRVGIAWTREELESQTGFLSLYIDERDFPVLTTRQSCGLPGARYLDVLRYQLLRFAKIAKIGLEGQPFAWHFGVHSRHPGDLTLEDREQLARMRYEIRDVRGQSEWLVQITLPRERFHGAYETRLSDAVKSRLPQCTYQGREPFQHVQMKLPSVTQREVVHTQTPKRRW